MLTKNLFIAKILVQIGVAIASNVNLKDNDKHKETVSKNWHKTQVFIYYDYWRFLEDKLDCLGTILTRRYILTAATCVLNSDVPLKDAIVYHDKENYDIEKYMVHQKFYKAAIFPDLAVMSLRTDIESKKLIAIREIYEFHPQDKAKGMNLNLNVEIVKYVFSSFFFSLTLQIDSVTCL